MENSFAVVTQKSVCWRSSGEPHG